MALIDPAAVEAWRREQRHEPACVRLLRDLAAIAPDLAADAALAGVAMHSPSTQGGGERQRLHAAARDIAANVEAALRAWAENRSLE